MKIGLIQTIACGNGVLHKQLVRVNFMVNLHISYLYRFNFAKYLLNSFSLLNNPTAITTAAQFAQYFNDFN